jgi:hypothetical protein
VDKSFCSINVAKNNWDKKMFKKICIIPYGFFNGILWRLHTITAVFKTLKSHKYQLSLIFKRSKIAPLCISIKMGNGWNDFFCNRTWNTSNSRSWNVHKQLDRVKCKVIWSISHDLFINNCNNYIISITKKPLKKAEQRNYYPIFNRCHCGVTRVAQVHG